MAVKVPPLPPPLQEGKEAKSSARRTVPTVMMLSSTLILCRRGPRSEIGLVRDWRPTRALPNGGEEPPHSKWCEGV